MRSDRQRHPTHLLRSFICAAFVLVSMSRIRHVLFKSSSSLVFFSFYFCVCISFNIQYAINCNKLNVLLILYAIHIPGSCWRNPLFCFETLTCVCAFSNSPQFKYVKHVQCDGYIEIYNHIWNSITCGLRLSLFYIQIQNSCFSSLNHFFLFFLWRMILIIKNLFDV